MTENQMYQAGPSEDQVNKDLLKMTKVVTQTRDIFEYLEHSDTQSEEPLRSTNTKSSIKARIKSSKALNELYQEEQDELKDSSEEEEKRDSLFNSNRIFNILYKDSSLAYNNESDDSFDNLHNQKSFRKNLKSQVTYQLMDVNYPSTIFKTNSQNFVLWQLIIVILSIYQVVSIPIAISFDPDIFDAPTFRTIDSLSDLAFVFDIVLNFRTSYIDPISGEEILSPFFIASKYLTSIQFYIDVLSSVPFNQFFPGVPLLNFLGLLKILRIRRVNNFIMDLNINLKQKTFLKVVFLVFIMLMYLHLASCIWYTVVQQEERWIPNMEFVFPESPMMYGYYFSNWGRTYIYTLYTSYFLFWMTEISAKNESQFLTAICILVLSSIMNGLIVGNMAHNINEINQDTKKLQKHLDTMNGAMKQLQLP